MKSSKKRENPPNLNVSLHSYARPSPRCLLGPAGLLVWFFPLLMHETPLSAHTSPPLQNPLWTSHSFAPTPPHSYCIKKHTNASLTTFFITFYSLLLHPLTIFSSVIAQQTQTRSIFFSHSKQKTHYLWASQIHSSGSPQKLSRNACSRRKRTAGTWDQTQVQWPGVLAQKWDSCPVELLCKSRFVPFVLLFKLRSHLVLGLLVLSPLT
jgi:hypothetical protein